MAAEPGTPFQFSTRLALQEATGLRAVSLAQLLTGLRAVPDACVYYHTHHYLLQHHYLTPEPPNDFAYWVTAMLGAVELGERLNSVDTIQFSTIPDLRARLIEVLEQGLKERPSVRLRVVAIPEAFQFVKSVSVILRTAHRASTLEEFVEGLRAVTIESVYFHMFEARLRLQRGSNDFSRWFESLGEARLARAIASLDPYTHTIEELRQTIIRLVQARLASGPEAR